MGVLSLLINSSVLLVNFNNGYFNQSNFDEYDFYVYHAWMSACQAVSVDYCLAAFLRDF